MFQENEDEIMKASSICSDGSSCRHMFASDVRAKQPGPHVKNLHWFHILLLVVLLAAQASCNEISAASSPLSITTTNAQTSVFYFVVVTVDVNGQKNESEIIAWLRQVFQNELQSCVSPNHEETTASPTSPQTTSASTSNETTLMTTATTTPVLESTNTTTPTTTPVLESTNTTTPTSTPVLEGTNTTTPATTVLEGTTTTTPTTTPVLESTSTTTPATTALKSTTTTTPATTTAATLPNGNDKPTRNKTNNGRARRELRGPVTQTSAISRDNTAGLFQDIGVSCAIKTAITHTNCSVTLQLKQRIPSCCILRTLCAASKTSPDIHVVGNSAEAMSPLLNECNSNTQELNGCTYTGQTGASCEESGTAYVVPQRNSTHCGADKENNTCSCSAYCDGTNAYYTFQLSTQDSKINISNVISMISKLNEQKNCASSSDVSCPLSNIASEYKDFNLECGSTATNCKVILGFSHEVPICNVSAAVMSLFQPEKQISFNGQVTRAAICGNSIVSDHPLTSNFMWTKVSLTSASFCATREDSDTFTCQNRINVLVQLKEQCVVGPFTTLGPIVTIAQPNTTTSSVNVTSSPLNTTTPEPNATTTAAAAVSLLNVVDHS